MAAQALYLKYRPLAFDEVVGQEPITRTLRNALRQGRLRHAYLFTGPRGSWPRRSTAKPTRRYDRAMLAACAWLSTKVG
jgi:replication-associated recombination protein RarA